MIIIMCHDFNKAFLYTFEIIDYRCLYRTIIDIIYNNIIYNIQYTISFIINPFYQQSQYLL